MVDVKVVPISLNYNPVIPRRGCNVKVRIGVSLSVKDYLCGSGKKQAQNLIMDLEAALKNLNRK